jgi:putative redox protein
MAQNAKPKAAWGAGGKSIFRTKSICPTPTLTKVSVRDFEILIDEPASNHGNDEGPQPLEYFLASLAGCTNVIINKIANEHNITLSDMEIDVVGVCNTRGIFGLEKIDVPFPEVRLTIRGKTRNSEAEIALLREQLAWRCPVKVITRQSGTTIKEVWDITYG